MNITTVANTFTLQHMDDNCYKLTVMQIKKVKPHVLLGLSGVGGVFSEEVDSQSLYLSSNLSRAHLHMFTCVCF